MAGASMLEAIRVPSVDGPDSFRHFLGQPGVKLRRDLIDLAIRGLLQAPAFFLDFAATLRPPSPRTAPAAPAWIGYQKRQSVV